MKYQCKKCGSVVVPGKGIEESSQSGRKCSLCGSSEVDIISEQGEISLNALADKIFTYAEQRGFHENVNFWEKLMMIVRELTEVMESYNSYGMEREVADTMMNLKMSDPALVSKDDYNRHVKGTVGEKFAGVMLNFLDFAKLMKIDLEWHLLAKLAYNQSRSFL
jgi:DNA-directed RNA polymerase subunit RPC12/RpoP